jgi:hypothetical protein
LQARATAESGASRTFHFLLEAGSLRQMGIHLKSTHLIAWIKGHIRLSILAGLALIYIGYELLSAVVNPRR